PEHAAGVVPVTISWTLDGAPQADDTSSTYRYDRPAYTVTFKADGGTPATRTQQVTEGDTATRPATDPTRDGYRFDGWFTGTTPVAYDFTRPVTQSITITAHWTGTNGQWTISPDHGPDTGGTTVTLTPPPARGIRFSQTSAGDWHSLGIDSKGDLYTWGYNSNGQLGRDTTGTPANRPGRVTPPTGVTFTQAVGGAYHSTALGSDGNIYTWGDNRNGQLGRDTTVTPADRPGRVTAPTGVTFTRISAGYWHSMALGSDGNLYTWGNDIYGQLGRDTTSSGAPTNQLPAPVTPPAGVRFTLVSAGGYHSMAIGSDGNVYTWGSNSKGQLGRDTTSSGAPTNLLPAPVTPPAGVRFTLVSAGGYHSMAIGSDGNVYTWGNNDGGQLGRSSSVTSGATIVGNSRPGPVSNPIGSTFTAVSAGFNYSTALTSDGTLMTWGENVFGQLGRKTSSGSTPGKVGAPTGVTYTGSAAGYTHSMAIGSDGNLYTWGSNVDGQLGRNPGAIATAEAGSVPFPARGIPTRVLFDRDQSTGPTAGADDTWTVTTPEHAAGGVPVTISWTLDGTPQADDTGNTYRYVTIGSLPLTGSHGILLLAAIGLTLMAATDAARRHRHPTRTTHTSHE
ncbi:InlB B-repeat-containing protein, partial [uncultured Bifidobacterium sp.]|uniref:RCC1 domain-containing protein n=1 Tax=uncultured Bifidobacterium sp. TaxID=165187 RepID=UPI002606865C